MRDGRSVMQTYLGDVQGDLVGITPLERGGEGACVLERNSTEGVDDTLYKAHPELAPARGTPVTLLLRPTGKEAASVATPQPEVLVSGELGQRLDAWLARAEGFGFSGVVLAERDGAVLLHKGYGLADRELGTPLTTASVFPMGSLGRQLTVVAVLQLAGAGKLSLDDLIDLHVDKVPEDKIPITVEMLLAHSSGLPDALPPSADEVGGTLGADRRATIARILAAPLDAPPGTPGVGGPLDDALLAAVVESAADDIWRGYVGEHLFAPAGMTSAGLLGEPRWPNDRLAHGYGGGPGTRVALPLPYDEPLTWINLGAGALGCTVRDVHRWLTALSGSAILAEAQRETFFSPACATWRVQDGAHGKVATAEGLTPGFRVEVRRWLDGDATLIVASNNEDPGLAAALGEMLFGAAAEPAPEVGVRTEQDVAKLAGDWVGEGVRLHVSAPKDDAAALRVEPLDQATLDLLEGADAGERQRREKFGARTMALLVAIANGKWDEAAGALGPGVTAAGAQASLGPWWTALGAGLGAAVSPSVIALGSEDGALAVDVEMKFEKGAARRRVLWRDGALADVRLPGAALGARRMLPEQAAGSVRRFVSWDGARGAGPALRGGPADRTAILQAGGREIELEPAP
jgi:CubicO group peptidase (beta-lactamase class C family)